MSTTVEHFIRERNVLQLWRCYECSTLIEREPGSTGIVLCERHK